MKKLKTSQLIRLQEGFATDYFIVLAEHHEVILADGDIGNEYSVFHLNSLSVSLITLWPDCISIWIDIHTKPPEIYMNGNNDIKILG